jgi:hypothetical protein
VFFVGVIQGACAGACDRANPRAFASSRQGADRRPSSGSNAHALHGLHVTFVLDVLMTGTVIMRGSSARHSSAEK